MNAHPAADLFPLMSRAELAELAEDIRANGLVEDITLHQGLVLDGRNRLRACELAGEPPRFHQFDGDDPVRFVISKNLTRRHLTAGQRAMIGAKARPMLQEQAAQRKREMGRFHRQRQMAGVAEISPPPPDQQERSWTDRASGQSAQQAGAAVGVSDWSVKRAGWLLADAPDLAAQVEAGELPLGTAIGQYEQRPAYQARQRKSPQEKGAEPKVPRKPGPKAAPPEVVAEKIATSLGVLAQELRRLPVNELTPETWEALRRQLDNVMAARTALRKARENSEVSHVA